MSSKFQRGTAAAALAATIAGGAGAANATCYEGCYEYPGVQDFVDVDKRVDHSKVEADTDVIRSTVEKNAFSSATGNENSSTDLPVFMDADSVVYKAGVDADTRVLDGSFVGKNATAFGGGNITDYDGLTGYDIDSLFKRSSVTANVTVRDGSRVDGSAISETTANDIGLTDYQATTPNFLDTIDARMTHASSRAQTSIKDASVGGDAGSIANGNRVHAGGPDTGPQHD